MSARPTPVPPAGPPRPPAGSTDDPTAAVAAMDGALPLVLLPMRLEARFPTTRATRDELRLRIYPDDLSADTHDPRLTDVEVGLGRDYWSAGWSPDAERDAWRTLVMQVPASRAAWIVRATEPSNLRDRPAGTPTFTPPPEASRRAPGSGGAARAALLPDRWVVLCLRAGTVVQRVVSGPVRRDLALGVAAEPDRADWTVRFDQAVAAGMAVRIPLDATSRAAGFDRIIVLGVRSSTTADEAAKQLAALLESHRYSRGAGFVPPGTPTTNLRGAPSGYPPRDPDGAVSFQTERRALPPVPNADGARVMRALGLPVSQSSHLTGSEATTDAGARAMNEALWPVTLGYFLGEMMAPVIPTDVVRDTREYVARYLRPAGPWPALRVGATPYGLLPVTSLAHWQPAPGAGPVSSALPDVLRRLLPEWRAQIGAVARVGRSDDPEADLVEVLGLGASSRQVRVRGVRGRDLQFNQRLLAQLDWAGYSAAQQAIARGVLNQLGVRGWNPRLAGMTFEEAAPRLDIPLVSEPDGGTDGAGGDAAQYLRWLRTADVDALRHETFPAGMTRPRALLYRLLRHSLLLAYGEAALEVMTRHGLDVSGDQAEPEIIGLDPGPASRRTVWQRMSTPLPPGAGSGTVADALKRALAGGSGTTDPTGSLHAGLRRILRALAQLETLPVATLERLTGETLDACAHRLDAWVTSLATERLDQMRGQRPTGVHVGAYGWLIDVRPGRTSPRSGGYVHAPSLRHAATAAVLRNAYLSAGADSGDAGRYAVDLSSARVRESLDLLDAVRGGQPLGAVLGQRFEHGLRERLPAARQLPYLSALRTLYPTAPAGTTSGAVVHGLLLRDAWAAGLVPFGRHGLPASGPDRAAIEAAIAGLDDATDAVADLLLAESVHQLVGGNTTAATASLDALARGTRPPDPEVARTPRGGTSVVHRVILDLGGPAATSVPWPGMDGPRSRTEPALARWVAQVLGDPRSVRASVTVKDPRTDGPGDTSTVTLADLGLGPLDVVALAAHDSAPHPPLELEHRIARVAVSRSPGSGPGGAPSLDRPRGGLEITIRYELGADDGPSGHTVPQLLALAPAVHAVTGSGRPLGPADLAPTGAAPDRLPEQAAEIRARAEDALAALEEAGERLQEAVEVLGRIPASPGEGAAGEGADGMGADGMGADREGGAVAALTEAALFGVACYPPPGATTTELLDLATGAARELSSRLAAARTARPGPGATPAETISQAIAMARAVFGTDYVLLPRCTVAGSGQGGAGDPESRSRELLRGDVQAPQRWLSQAAAVRPALARWTRLLSYARALGSPVPQGAVDQLPYRPGTRWAALPFEDARDRPPNGCVSLLTYRSPAGGPIAGPPPDTVGLLLDEWTETIPDRDVDTGLALHVESPGAQAPQVVLVTVPPVRAARWDLDFVVAAVGETLDLAMTRAVDGNHLGALGQYLPGLYLSANAAGDAVSTTFTDALVDETPIVTES